MLKHVAWQMRHIPGGLGEKMEDWIERGHQTGMRLRERFRTVENPVIRALAREKANSRSPHPDVITHVDAINSGNKRSFSEIKVDDKVSTQRKRQRDTGRYEAMINFEGKPKMKHTWSVLIFEDAKGSNNDFEFPPF